MLGRVIRAALRSMLRRPVRTLLMIQGVLWGTALGVSLPAVLKGSRAAAEQDAERLGTDRILVGQTSAPQEKRYTWALVDELRQAFARETRVVTGVGVRYARIASGNDVVPLLLVDEYFFKSRKLDLIAGRLPTIEEIRTGAAVAVVPDEGIPLPHPVRPGTKLSLANGPDLEVIGVFHPESLSVDQFGYDRSHFLRELIEEAQEILGVARPAGLGVVLNGEAIIVPHRVFLRSHPLWIEVRTAPSRVRALKERLFAWLAERGYEPVVYANVLAVVLYSDTIRRVEELNRVVFAVAVIVGAMVVSCLMLLNVWDRRREIAIRRVEGARWWHIVVQFVLESATTCLAGGVLGVPTGLALAELRCRLAPAAGVTWTVPVAEILLTLIAVFVAGILAGLVPAAHAVRVDPVEVLRFE